MSKDTRDAEHKAALDRLTEALKESPYPATLSLVDIVNSERVYPLTQAAFGMGQVCYGLTRMRQIIRQEDSATLLAIELAWAKAQRALHSVSPVKFADSKELWIGDKKVHAERTY